MFFKKLDNIIKKIKIYSKIKKKKTCFIISNTKKISNRKNFFTPLRESKECIYSGIVISRNETAESISKFIDGKIKYIFVDIEKKIKKDKFHRLVNIERSVKDNIKLSEVKNIKPNDITVNAAENLIYNFFQKDIRGVGGKKIVIIGTGNIGGKLALKLVEAGAYVYLYRRNKKKLKIISKSINILKPEGTLSYAKPILKSKFKLDNFDVIIGASNNLNTINSAHFEKIKNNSLIIDIGKGSFSKNAILKINKNNNIIYRLDIETSLSLFLDSSVINKIKFNKNISKKFNDYNIVQKGVLGMRNDIIVDNIKKPKKIIGISDGKGDLLHLTTKKKKKLKKELNII
jgi:hypothetical protein